jgi:DNA-binding transcriptional LysR family regulator
VGIILLLKEQHASGTEVGAMDFTALRYFSETAHSRSIRAASERLHVSPSAISRQIAKLEHELRAPMFDRRAQGMTLTPAGEILQEKFERMMREFERVKSDIAALQDLQAGTVDVYCFQTAIESFVAPVMHRFHVQYPNVVFNVKVSSTDETIEALSSGVAEIGLILNPPVRDTIISTQVFRDAIVAAVSPTHPFAKRKVVSLRELVEFPFVLTEKSFGLRQQIDRMFDRHALKPEVFCVTNSLTLVKGIAGGGHQCALLPRSAIQREAAEGTLCSVAVKEFVAEPWVFCVCTLSARSLSPAAKVFMGAVVDYCRRYRR